MQLFLLLLFDILNVFQLLLQLVDGCVFEFDLILELIQSNCNPSLTCRLIR